MLKLSSKGCTKVNVAEGGRGVREGKEGKELAKALGQEGA